MSLEIEDADNFSARAVKVDVRDFAAGLRIEFNRIHTLRSVEDGLVRYCAVEEWFNSGDELSAKFLFPFSRSLTGVRVTNTEPRDCPAMQSCRWSKFESSELVAARRSQDESYKIREAK